MCNTFTSGEMIPKLENSYKRYGIALVIVTAVCLADVILHTRKSQIKQVVSKDNSYTEAIHEFQPAHEAHYEEVAEVNVSKRLAVRLTRVHDICKLSKESVNEVCAYINLYHCGVGLFVPLCSNLWEWTSNRCL